MERALREVLVPKLRSAGFKGSLPHLRRKLADRVEYLSVQFNSAGGSFVAELVSAPGDGKPLRFGRELPIDKLNVTYFNDRLRLESRPEAGVTDHWFEFGPKSYDPPQTVPAYEHFVQIARTVAHHFAEAEASLAEQRRTQL